MSIHAYIRHTFAPLYDLRTPAMKVGNGRSRARFTSTLTACDLAGKLAKKTAKAHGGNIPLLIVAGALI